jgi:hypothetical protein
MEMSKTRVYWSTNLSHPHPQSYIFIFTYHSCFRHFYFRRFSLSTFFPSAFLRHTVESKTFGSRPGSDLMNSFQTRWTLLYCQCLYIQWFLYMLNFPLPSIWGKYSIHLSLLLQFSLLSLTNALFYDLKHKHSILCL